ncbi:hypothetical protein L2E82_30555 [Cichorium intybus]|uniref:Uncharacterized protein n=1 Tax=Cichorium intybus TaxID=13427 RepID=A0ACB9D0P3_CICIN|nr:hypothetical protein L2E82_30555 [Cichorium intybus]
MVEDKAAMVEDAEENDADDAGGLSEGGGGKGTENHVLAEIGFREDDGNDGPREGGYDGSEDGGERLSYFSD